MPNAQKSTTISYVILEKYRRSKGFTDLALAEASGISTRAIERARHGDPIAISSAKRIAQALGISLDLLILGKEVDPPAVEPDLSARRFRVRIRLSTPPASLLERAQINRKVALIERIIGATDTAVFEGCEDGNTMLVLKMLDADILRLLAAMLDGILAELEVRKVHIPDHSWILDMIALLHWRGEPIQPDAEGWLGLMDAAEWDKLHTKTPCCFLCTVGRP